MIIQESKNENSEAVDFVTKRKKGAEKIESDAQEKGGYSKLTYFHFKGKVEAYKDCLEMLNKGYKKEEFDEKFHIWKDKISSKSSTQKIFQIAIGKAEVYGEVALFLRGKKT